MFSWRDDTYYAREAEELLQAHGDRLRWAASWLQLHHPDFADRTHAEVFDTSLSIEGARLAIARELGFDRWAALSERAQSLGHEEPDDADSTSQEALKAVERGNADALDATQRWRTRPSVTTTHCWKS